jgi:hypothetical protein
MDIRQAMQELFSGEAVDLGNGKIIALDGGAPIIQDRNGRRVICDGVDDLLRQAQRQAPASQWAVRR